jgi:NAD(P)-dependent dehydrogenase (short-subunit alcohol dehydrogenase family)
MGRLAGKAALITGGGGGIGSTIGAMFAAEGAKVLLTDIDGERAAAAAGRIDAARPGHAFALAHDVTSEAQWRDVVDRAERHMGRLDVLVNNAGLATKGTVEELDLEAWRRTMAVNLDAVYLGCRTALPVLRRCQPAAIVNISSVSGLVAGHNLAAYNATKSVALQAARDGDDIRVNSIHPAFIETAMLRDVMGGATGTPLSEEELAKFAKQIPLKRIGTAEDVGYAAIYLASDESRFMTGSELVLDGGITAR